MKKYIALVLFMALFGINIASAHSRHNPEPTPSPIPSPTPLPVSSTVWGAYTGNTDQSMTAFEQQVGKQMKINAIFWGWDSPFPSSAAGSQGKTLLIFWEPTFGYTAINSGKYDSYIKQFAAGAKAYGYSVILAPFDEFNLNETPYGNTIGGNTPQNFISAWQRVHNIFTSVGATNVKFAIDYNNVSIPSILFSNFYPGSAYVDYVGIDGFNFNGATFSQAMSGAIAQAQLLSKPVYVMSTGAQGSQTAWIQALGAQQGIAGWIWFNQSPWNITSTSLSTFQSIIK